MIQVSKAGVEIGVGRRIYLAYGKIAHHIHMAMENQSCHLLPPGHVYGLLTVNIFSALFGTVGNLLIIETVRTNFTLQIISNYWFMTVTERGWVSDLL